MSEPLLDVTFEATADDFLAYAAHVAEQGEFYLSQMRSTRLRVVVIVAVISPLLAVVSTPDWSPIPMLVFALVGWIVAAILWFAWPSIWRRQLKAITQRQVAMENPLVLFGQKRYVFDADAVRFSGPHSGGYVTWPAIMSVTSDERGLYLHVSQGSAHIIPSRAFRSPSEFAAAVDLATQLYQTGR